MLVEKAGWTGLVIGILIGAMLMVGTAAFAGGSGEDGHTFRNSPCVEDEVLVPVDFSKNGDHYICANTQEFIAKNIEERAHFDGTIRKAVRGSICEHPRVWHRAGVVASCR